MAIIKTNIYIDGTLLPPCAENGISATYNKLYAANAGRSSTTGDFIGDIITGKWDITAEWDGLNEAETLAILAYANSLTVEHTVKMMFDGATYEEKQCYIADSTRKAVRQRNNGEVQYGKISLHIVQM